MKHRKQLERRSFNQDRFDILIKRQKSGKATFNELTELDEIVNRDADIREIVLEEMQGFDEPPDDMQQPSLPENSTEARSLTWFDRLIGFFKRLFNNKVPEDQLLLS